MADARVFALLRLHVCTLGILQLRRLSPVTSGDGDCLDCTGARAVLVARIPDAACTRDSLGYWLSTKPKGTLIPTTRNRQPQTLLLLLLAGDVSLNPGPRPSCPRCDRAVYDSVAALQCDKCNAWLHRTCESLSLRSYRRM
ncbi:uncharacterized protein ISCGN_019408 [Ixodes scapularis]